MSADFPSEGRRRRAVVRGMGVGPALVTAYLPANYKVVDSGENYVVIEGVDNMGWSMDLYVKPRLASALLTVEEEDPE